MRRGLLSAVVAYAIGTHAYEAFNPRVYEQFKQKATCKALNRHGGEGVPDDVHIDIGGFCSGANQNPEHLQVVLTLLDFVGYLNINPSASSTMLMVHGWPVIWTTWSRQISRFEKEYNLLVPDLRGFASSTHPGDVEASGTIGDMVGDMLCVLDHAGVQQAICVGHDWGATVCHEAARTRPDRFEAVVGITVPVSMLRAAHPILSILNPVLLQYLPSDKQFTPVEELAKTFHKLSYQVYFEKSTETAIAELNKDTRRSLRAVLRTKSSPPPDSFLTSTSNFLDAYSGYKEIPPPPFYSPQEEDYMVEEFSKQGFNYTLQFYTYYNRYESWRVSHEQGNYTIPQQALFVAPLADPVADWILVMKLLGTEQFMPHLTTKTIDAQHWPHLEAPEEFNKILDEWLKALGVQRAESEVKERPQEPVMAQVELQEAKVKRDGSGEEL
jgi:soluble epoxide hydrolase/lipid-phosphate phosphatase